MRPDTTINVDVNINKDSIEEAADYLESVLRSHANDALSKIGAKLVEKNRKNAKVKIDSDSLAPSFKNLKISKDEISKLKQTVVGDYSRNTELLLKRVREDIKQSVDLSYERINKSLEDYVSESIKEFINGRSGFTKRELSKIQPQDYGGIYKHNTLPIDSGTAAIRESIENATIDTKDFFINQIKESTRHLPDAVYNAIGNDLSSNARENYNNNAIVEYINSRAEYSRLELDNILNTMEKLPAASNIFTQLKDSVDSVDKSINVAATTLSSRLIKSTMGAADLLSDDIRSNIIMSKYSMADQPYHSDTSEEAYVKDNLIDTFKKKLKSAIFEIQNNIKEQSGNVNYYKELIPAKAKLLFNSKIKPFAESLWGDIKTQTIKNIGSIKKSFVKLAGSGPLILLNAASSALHLVAQQIMGASIKIFTFSRKFIFRPAMLIVNGFVSLLKQAVSQSQMLQSVIQLAVIPFILMLEYTLLPVIKALTPIITNLIHTVAQNKDVFIKWGNILANIVKEVIEPSLKLLETNFLSNPLQGLFDMFNGISSNFRDWIIKNINSITDMFANSGTSAVKFLASSMQVAAAIAKALSTAILFAVNSPEWKEAYPVMVEAFKSILDSVRDVLTSSSIKTMMKDLVGIFIGNLIETAKELLFGNKSDDTQKLINEQGGKASDAYNKDLLHSVDEGNNGSALTAVGSGLLALSAVLAATGIGAPIAAGTALVGGGMLVTGIMQQTNANEQKVQYINNNYNNTTVSTYQEGAYIS